MCGGRALAVMLVRSVLKIRQRLIVITHGTTERPVAAEARKEVSIGLNHTVLIVSTVLGQGSIVLIVSTGLG